jgi:hypothetical protein
MKKLASMLCAVFLITFVGVNSASAEPVNLDNGYINSNIFYSFLHNDLDGDGEPDGDYIYLYRTPFDASTQLEIANESGLGVTLISGGKCFTTNIFDLCGNNHDEDATIISTSNDFSGVKSFSQGEVTYSYGTVVTTQEVVVNENKFQVRNTINLNQDESFLTIVTQVKNINASATSVDLYVNNYDGMIGSDSRYRMTRGNLVDGAFTALTLNTENSNAVIADSNPEEYGDDPSAVPGYGAILFTTESETTSTIYNFCCSPAGLAGLPNTVELPNVAGTDLSLAGTGVSFFDGSYGIKKSISISSQQTYEIKWGFGGGTYSTSLNPILLESLQEGVAQASAPEWKSAAIVAQSPVRQSSNLSFAQSMYGSDTLSDPDGQLRALLDYIFSVYGQ